MITVCTNNTPCDHRTEDSRCNLHAGCPESTRCVYLAQVPSEATLNNLLFTALGMLISEDEWAHYNGDERWWAVRLYTRTN